jgi:ribosomal protein S18 acetylase RimI-like enzyme
LADLRERMKGSAGKFEDSNRKLPEGEGARFVNLGEAGADEVTRLYANHIAHMEPLIGLREAFRIDEQVDSVVLLIGDRVVGFVLARVQEGTLHVPAWVVAPEYRERSIGNVLLFELFKRVRGRVERMRFEFTDAAIATPRVLHLPGYNITKVAARFERRVGA